MFFQTSSAPQDSLQSLSCKQQSPLSSQALQLLQTQLYQDEKHLLCFHSFLEQLMPARQAVQWEVEKRGRKRMWAGSEIKSPFMFVKEEERAVIITLEALDCNFSPLCVNLCIHQVFAGGLWKEPHSSCLHLSVNTTDKLSRELAIYSPHNALTITSCVWWCWDVQILKYAKHWFN